MIMETEIVILGGVRKYESTEYTNSPEKIDPIAITK